MAVNPAAYTDTPTPTPDQLSASTAQAASAGAGVAGANAKAADDQHHSVLGRVASALLGTQTEYRPNPTTGVPEAQEVKEKPGDLFRHIVAGAILGGAAAKGQRSALGGFAAGGVAGIQANRAMNEQKFQRAQEAFKNQQEVQRSQREERAASRADQELEFKRTQAKAQWEMWNKENVLHERDANLREAEYNQRLNENQQAIERWAHEAGAIDAAIPGNNEIGKGKDLQEMFTKEPDKFKAPDGYHRVITHETDMTGLTYDKDKGYVDEKGNPVDLKDRTAWHVMWLPEKTQPVATTMGELYDKFPNAMGAMPKGTKADQTVRMPVDQLGGLAQKEHEIKRKDADEDYKRTHDEITAELGELKSKAKNLEQLANEAERQFDTDTAAALRKEMKDTYDEYDRVKLRANPHSPIRNFDSGRPAEVSDDKAAIDVVLQKPGMVAVKAGGKIGPVPEKDVDAFLKKYPGSTVVGRPTKGASPTSSPSAADKLSDISSDTTLMSDGALIPNAAIKTYTDRHKGVTVVGQGTKNLPQESEYTGR